MKAVDSETQRSNGKYALALDLGRFASASVFAQASGMLRNLWLPLILVPSQLGSWNLLSVILGYAAHADIGALHGMNKTVPMYRGRGDTEASEGVVDSVFSFVTIVGVLAAVVVLLIGMAEVFRFGEAVYLVALLVFVKGIYTFQFCLLRAVNQVSRQSASVVLFSFFGTLFVCCLAMLFDDALLGAVLGLLLAYSVVVVIVFGGGGLDLRWKFRTDYLAGTIKVGAPVVLLGLLHSVFISIDRWIIVGLFGSEVLGYYAVAVTAGGVMAVVPAAAGSILYPRMLERSSSAGDPTGSQRLYLRALVPISCLTVLVGVGVIVVLPPAITIALPAYKQAIQLVYALSPGTFFLAMCGLSGTFVVSADRQMLLIGSQLVSIAMLTSIMLISVQLDLTLVQLTIVVSCAYATYGLSYLLLSFHVAIGSWWHGIRLLWWVVLPYLSAASALVLLCRANAIPTTFAASVSHILTDSAVVGAVMALPALLAHRKSKAFIDRELRPSNKVVRS